MKKLSLVLLLTIIAFLPLRSQDFGEILQAGTADAQTYFEKYTGPIMASLSNGLGAGWYNTAKPHKLLGIDITGTFSVANIPSGERTFEFNENDFENLILQNSSTNTLPTIVGNTASGDAELVIPLGVNVDIGNGQTIRYDAPQRFPVPGGIGDIPFPIIGFPVPVVQVGIGLPKNTDLKLRYGSDFGLIDDGSITIFGIGILHDLKQWIPGLKQIPFDASGFIGFTNFNTSYDILIVEDDFIGDGSVELNASSFTLQGVISKKLAILTPYVGIGFVIGSSSLDVKGNYVYADSQTSLPVSVTDPISLDFDGGSSPRINAGLRLKLLILTFHAEYALQKYNTLTAGIGISIR